jgi:hypothetical protein
MKQLGYVAFASLMVAAASAQAVTAAAYPGKTRVDLIVQAEGLGGETRATPDLLRLAKKEVNSEKTVVKTKNDGTVVTKTTTKTNDGEGNKSTTRTKTTDKPSTGGATGASYEGQ